MTFKKIFFLIFLLTGEAGAQPNMKVLSLTDAINAGLEQNPAYRGRMEKTNQAEANITVRRSLLMPNVTAMGAALQKKDAASNVNSPFAGDRYNQYTSSIRLTQTVFQVGSLSGIGSAKKDWELSKLDSQVATRDLTNDIINAYYFAVLSKRNLDTLKRQQKIVQESLNVAQRRESTGWGQRSDVLQVRTQLALLEAQITTAVNQFEVSVANLARLLGTREDVAFQIKDNLEAPELKEIDQAVDLKNYQIPEITMSRLYLDQIEDEKKMALGQHLPSLAILGDYNFNSYKSADLFDSYSNGWSVGVQLTIPLFSGFSSVYQQRSLSSRQLQLEHQKRSTEDQITFQQVSNRKGLEAAHASIITGLEAVKLAQASSNEAQKNYRLSRMDFFQFFQVQQAYLQAEQALNNYKYNYIVAIANYYVASGQDLAQLVATLERVNK